MARTTCVAVGLLVCMIASAVHADIITRVFDDEALFLAYAGANNVYHETFADLNSSRMPDAESGVYSDPLAYGPIKDFSFVIWSEQGLIANPSTVRPGGLSAVSSDAMSLIELDFSGSPKPVYGVGGHFFASDELGGIVEASVLTLTLSNGYVRTLTGSGFLGFWSDVPLTSLTIHSDGYSYATVQDLYLVPVPAALVLGAMGLGLVYWTRRRMA